MKYSPILVLLFCMVASPFGWPLDPDDVSHKTDRIYGCYSREWDEVTSETSNFHPGIDLQPPVGTTFPPVHPIAEGIVRDIVDYTAYGLGYVVVVEDDLNPGNYWCYQHLNAPSYSEEEHLDFSEIVGTMYDMSSSGFTHLHLQRIDYPEWDPVTEPRWPGGIADPLNLLEPSNAGYWAFTELPGPSEHPWFYFLKDMSIDDWANWSSMQDAYEDTLAADDLHGAVDIVKGFSVVCTGEYGTNPSAPLVDMPARISWDCIKLNETGFEIVFSRYPVNFIGEFGSTDDWEKYKQFYFRYGWQFFDGAIATCITNCNDNTSWNGIDNVEENCWNTALSAEGSGESYNPLNMVTQDGVYFIRTTEYAWDSSIQQDGIECILTNNKEIAQEVRLSDAATDQDIWHAEWTASYDTDGFEPVKNVYVNETTEPGTTLDIEIVFSGPMSTAVDPYVRFTKPEGGYIVASPGSPEWTSTNQPDGYYDTWNGTVDVPSDGFSGWMTMKIKAKDISDIGLLDPSIAYPDSPSPTDEEYTDDHHGFGIAVTPEPGWPVFLEHWISGSPVAGDLDGDGDMDIAVQSKEGVVQLIDESGNILQSMESGDWSGYNYPLVSSPAIADLDLDGDMEVIAVHPYGANAWHAETGSPVPGWPVYMGNESTPGIYPARSAPVVCDLIGDAHPEVVICRHLDLTSPYSVCTVWLFGHDGGQPVWQTELESGGVSVASTPAAGDISISHAGSEILVCTSDGYVSNYPYPPPDRGRDWNSALYLLAASDGSEIWKSDIYNCYFFASPVVGDVDGDGLNEIVVGTHIDQAGHRVLILDAENGNLEHSFSVSSTVPNSSALGDMDGDGCLDIVSVDNTGHVYCWSGADYSNIDGFPVEITGNPSLTSPTIADIDGDFQQEIVVGTGDGEVYAINNDGTICSGYPLTGPVSIEGQPVVANLDNDSSLELVFADGSDSYIYCYDLGDNSFPALMPWRQFQHDSRHTGLFEADNTVPAPPTNLQVTQQTDDYGMLLTWDLSVNDFHSSSPEEPTDVVSYQIYRGYPPYTLPSLVSRVHAGTETYIDTCDPWGHLVEYYLTASDGTNESIPSNVVRVRIEPADIISCGCSVSEVFEDMPPRAAVSVRPASEISSSRRDDSETSDLSPASSVRDESASLRGNPSCLTDGSFEEGYTPSQGAGSVVIDLGEECSITAVVPQDQLIEQRDIVGSTSAVDTQERQLRIEVAGSDRHFELLGEGTRRSIEGVRYVRVHDASGLAEISVYGSRSSTNSEPMSLDIVENLDSEGWSFSLPAQMLEAGGSSELSVKIFDITGRMVWSGRTRSGSVLHWDGCSEGTPVPSGVYLLQCSIGSEVSTGSFVVRSDR